MSSWLKVSGRLTMVSACVFLVACQGTVKQVGESSLPPGSKVAGLKGFDITLSSKVQAELPNHPTFNQQTFQTVFDRAFAQSGLIGETSSHRVEIQLTDVRVRSTFSAIMFGLMAGDDHIDGKVNLLSDDGRLVKSFQVNSSYAFGGIAGGQDSTRMDWLYKNFSDLTIQELDKFVGKPGTGKPAISSVNQVPKIAVGAQVSSGEMKSAPVPAVVPQTPVSVPVAVSTTAPAAAVQPSVEVAGDVVQRDPQLSQRYKTYTTRPNPKAFAVSDNGGWWMAWGESQNPAVKETITQRALRGCEERSKSRCVLYAVDDKVVFGQGADTKR